jgi:hypothetical protein
MLKQGAKREMSSLLWSIIAKPEKALQLTAGSCGFD